MKKNPLLLLSGPSGVGKTTLIERILVQMPKLRKILSHTTRPQRKNEQKESYFFVDEKSFFEKEKQGEFAEFALIYHYYYAVSKKEIEQSWLNQRIPIKDVDIQGLRSLRKVYPQCFSIGIFPPYIEKARERIEKRNVDFGKNLKTRLESQNEEIKELKEEVDISIINDDIEKAVENLKKEIENYLNKL